MSKVTSKLQVTVPKAIAERYGIGPGDRIDWIEAGSAIRVRPARPGEPAAASAAERVRRFDQATRRVGRPAPEGAAGATRRRGGTREELYGRGRAR